MSKKIMVISGVAASLLTTTVFFQNCGQKSKEGYNVINSLEVEKDGQMNKFTNNELSTSRVSSKTTMDEISTGKSILITNHNVLNELVSNVDFGYLLGRTYVYMKNDVNPNNAPNANTVGEFVANIFNTAYQEQRRHADSPASQKLGSDPKADRYLNNIFKNWMPIERMEGIRSASDLRGGPFRLLAITNLMENAGNIDNRGTSEASADPRALGELHLIYGTIDRDYEQTDKAYPQTWVLAYRLPPIKLVDGQWKVDKNLSQTNLMRQQGPWQEQMKNWARVWGELSKFEINSTEYKNHLRRILALITDDATNHINIRSNTRLNEEEFELREWYMLMQSKQFIPRKPRQEPYPCLSGSNELGKVVSWYWRPDLNDLDFSTFETSALNIPPSDKDANGYTLPRDSNNDLFRRDNIRAWSTCAQDRRNMSFEMDGQGFNDPEPRVMMSVPFARIKNEGKIWKLPNQFTEQQRHSFAIRTCSGCHSQEGAANGFHIFPRLKNQDSRLSPFLTGIGNNKFRHAGAEYAYDQLQARKKWHIKAMNGDATLFKSLQREDRLGH